MELSKTHRQTDVGLIPIDWLLQPFEQVLNDFKGGASFKPSDFTESGVPVIPKSGIVRGGILSIKPSDQQFCSYTFASKNESNCVDKNYSVIVLRDLVPAGPNIGLIVEIKDDNKYIMAQGVYGFTVKDGTSPQFIIHLSNSGLYRKLMQSILVGSTQVHIRNTTLRKTKIPFPPTLKEQTAIATALSDADALITSLEKLIAKKRNIKQGAMQQLLNPKKGWEVKRVEELADVKSGKRLPLGKSLVESRTPYPYIRIVDMANGGISLSDIKYVPEDVYPVIKNYRIFKDDIYISVAGTLGIVGTIPIELDGANLTENANRLTEIKCNRDYLLMVLKSDLIQNRIEAERTLGAQPKLALTRIRNFDIPLPPPEEQEQIARILLDIDAEITRLESKLEKYRQIKSGMMQNLLTGKIRLV